MLSVTPLLCIGIIWASFKISGNTPVEKDLLMRIDKGTDNISLAIINNFTGSESLLLDVFFNLDMILEISQGVTWLMKNEDGLSTEMYFNGD